MTEHLTIAHRHAARKVAVYELWRRGILYYKLHPYQREMYNRIVASKSRRHFLSCSRRLGKSFMLVCLALEMAMQKPGARVLYLAPWSKDAADIFTDASAQIFADCPQEFKPDKRHQTKEMVFKNGSLIRFRGVNGEHGQFLRGGAADLVILDECGIMDDLKHVVNDIVTPMTLTTNGTVIMATTPSRTPAHESKIFFEQALAAGAAHEYDIRYAYMLDDAQRTIALAAAGEKQEDIPAILAGTKAPTTTTALREYFCKWVVDAGSAIVPEFDAQAKIDLVKSHERPPFFDAYVSMDPGMVDNSGILFGYWDIRAGKLVIEDEWMERGSKAGTPELAKAITDKEQELWGERAPYMRICDTEKRVISDLTRVYGLPFVPAAKNDSMGAIWLMRQFVKNRTLVINPKCTSLIRQLENAVFNKSGKDFERDTSPDGIDGHYDLLAALKYLCRMVNTGRNPYPSYYVHGKDKLYKSFRDPETGEKLTSIRPQTSLAKRFDAAGK